VPAKLLHASVVTRPVAAGLDGEDDALRAAGAHETLGVVRRREQAQRHLDDVGFHLLDAGERAPAAERILVEVFEEGRATHLRYLVARLEVEKRRLARLPVDVSRLHRPQLP